VLMGVFPLKNKLYLDMYEEYMFYIDSCIYLEVAGLGLLLVPGSHSINVFMANRNMQKKVLSSVI
jgi:hypothetical protein